MNSRLVMLMGVVALAAVLPFAVASAGPVRGLLDGTNGEAGSVGAGAAAVPGGSSATERGSLGASRVTDVAPDARGARPGARTRPWSSDDSSARTGRTSAPGGSAVSGGPGTPAGPDGPALAGNPRPAPGHPDMADSPGHGTPPPDARPRARCGPELSSPDGLEAQTCVLAHDGDTWARTYYRNASGAKLTAVLTLMAPRAHTVRTRCPVGAADEPGVCETPREPTSDGPGGYAAVAEFAAAPGTAHGPHGGPLLLRSGSGTRA